ncbi:MAG: hypothetical protein KDA47_14035 [Planctomycetales bacterium]|nr:hypothetical protein [Planctomycetales bacterium]
MANLTADRHLMAESIAEIEDFEEGKLPIAREEREELFGDEPEDKRTQTSIIARLQLYQATIRAMFPTQPLADSLPEIFPASTPTELPRVRFAFIQLAEGVRTWHEVPADVSNATYVYLKEGAETRTAPLTMTTPGDVEAVYWSELAVIDDLDDYELRDENNFTVANGQYDPTLPPPTTGPLDPPFDPPIEPTAA